MLSNLSLVSGLVIITNPPMPVDIVHLSRANFLLLALCRYTFPSAFCFSLNTHLQSIAFFPAFESFLSNVTLHSSMWMPVANPPYKSSLQDSDLNALTVFATCVCNSDDLFPTWSRLLFQSYAYTIAFKPSNSQQLFVLSYEALIVCKFHCIAFTWLISSLTTNFRLMLAHTGPFPL